MDKICDRINRIDTTSQHELKDLNIKSTNQKHGKKYQACRYGIVVKSFELLDVKLSDRTLLDIGCGKGRVLYLALRAGFGNVVGVDFSSELCAQAKKNLSGYEENSTIVSSDIIDFEIPNEVSVFFMFNPFDELIMRKIVRKLRDQANFHNEVYLIYVNPIASNILKQFGFNLIKSRFSPNSNNIIHLYKASK